MLTSVIDKSTGAHEQKAWAEVRNEMNPTIDWLIAGYNLSSRTDITVLEKGSGGISNCASALPDNKPVFGGCKLATGRFVTFYHCPDSVSVMDKGRYVKGPVVLLVG